MTARHGTAMRRGGPWWALVAVLVQACVNAGPVAGAEDRAGAGCACGQPVPEVQRLADGVYLVPGHLAPWGPAHLGQVANSGFVVGKRCVAVIDSGGSPAAGRLLQAAIARTTDRPVCFVINTHAHPDHVLGNAAFLAANGSPAPQFVGHARLAAALAARGPFYLQALRRDFDPAHAAATVVPPTRSVDGTLELDLGERRLQLQAWPTAHTDADLTVYDPASSTLWLGDLLFAGHIPVLDGRLNGWLDVLDALRQLPARVAVPGHGAPSHAWPDLLEPQQRYLQQLRQQVRAALQQGLTLAQTVDRLGRELPGAWALADWFHRRNLTAAYAELEWEP